jgi:copper chaperone NosL
MSAPIVALVASRVGRALAVAVLVVVAASAGCAPAGPREIVYGEEPCGFCRMTITDPRYGAQVRTAHGRVQAFDAIECAAGFVRTLPEGELRGVWVSDHDAPGSFVEVERASFWHTTGTSTPMGSGLVATAGDRPPAGLVVDGAALRWADVQALVEQDGPRGAAGMGGSHVPTS